MKIRDKHRKLRDGRFVTDMITQSVYGTMQLEQQAVPMREVKKIVQRTHVKYSEDLETT